MSNLGLAQRTWQIADATVTRAIEALANAYDSALKTLNKAFDFTDSVTTVRNALTVLGNTTAQNVAVQSIASAAGFKAYVGMWAYGATATGTSAVQMTFGSWGSTTFTGSAVPDGFGGWVAPFPGSVLAITGRADGGGPKNITLTVYINNVATAQTTTAAVLAAANSSFNTTFKKGAYPFAAGDVIDVRLGASTATGTDVVVAALLVEMGA